MRNALLNTGVPYAFPCNIKEKGLNNCLGGKDKIPNAEKLDSTGIRPTVLGFSFDSPLSSAVATG